MSVDPIIEPTALSDIAAARVLDARSTGAYDAAHVRGAVRVPLERWEPKARPGATAFDDTHYWQREIAALGIGPGDLVLIYDDGRMIEASRAWLILQYFGVDARILNGGWPALTRAGDGLQANASPATEPFRAAPGAGPVHLIDRDELKQKLETDVGIFDARTAAEFDGEDLRQNDRGGHLPGSKLLPHSRLLDDGRVKQASELKNLLANAGLDDRTALITLCDAGGRAALAAVAAVRAGHSDVYIYYPSFSDWAKDQTCPVVRGGPSDAHRASA